jgi:hypothetical protein
LEAQLSEFHQHSSSGRLERVNPTLSGSISFHLFAPERLETTRFASDISMKTNLMFPSQLHGMARSRMCVSIPEIYRTLQIAATSGDLSHLAQTMHQAPPEPQLHIYCTRDSVVVIIFTNSVT